jgi:isochorismate synthase
VQDERNATVLLNSGKERLRHHTAVADLLDKLQPHCHDLELAVEPRLLRTDAAWHLSTWVTGIPRERGSALDLALAVRPDPVLPDLAAEPELSRMRPQPGIIGWMDASGDGDWAVVSRYVEITDTRMRLHVAAEVFVEAPHCENPVRTMSKFDALTRALRLAD